MSTERILILPETAYSQDAAAANKGLVVDMLVNGVYSNLSKKLFAPEGAVSISSVRVNYVRKYAGNVYLRFGITQVPQASGSTPVTQTGTYAAYTSAGTDGKVVALDVPVSVLSGISLSANDRLGLIIERDAFNALDTYEADFEIESIEFFFQTIPAVATAYDLVSLSEVKSYLKISATDTSKDNLLQGWISDVSRSIEAYCQNKIRRQQVLGEIHNGDGVSEQWTTFSPITDIYGATDNDKLASVQYRNSPLDAWINLATDVRNILIDSADKKFIELYDMAFPTGRSNIKVSYYAGFDPVPGDIKNVCLEMAAMMWKESNQGENRLGVQSTADSTSGSNFNTTFRSLKPEWRLVLNRYRGNSKPVAFSR